MCTLTFVFSNGQTLKCEHINSVSYVTSDKKAIKLAEKELIEKFIPISTPLWLSAENHSFVVNGVDLLSIEITAE